MTNYFFSNVIDKNFKTVSIIATSEMQTAKSVNVWRDTFSFFSASIVKCFFTIMFSLYKTQEPPEVATE